MDYEIIVTLPPSVNVEVVDGLWEDFETRIGHYGVNIFRTTSHKEVLYDASVFLEDIGDNLWELGVELPDEFVLSVRKLDAD